MNIFIFIRILTQKKDGHFFSENFFYFEFETFIHWMLTNISETLFS